MGEAFKVEGGAEACLLFEPFERGFVPADGVEWTFLLGVRAQIDCAMRVRVTFEAPEEKKTLMRVHVWRVQGWVHVLDLTPKEVTGDAVWSLDAQTPSVVEALRRAWRIVG